MNKFEYKKFKSKELPDDTAIGNLNILGNEGWQLVYLDLYNCENQECWLMMREKENV